jgi:hypothetical protein
MIFAFHTARISFVDVQRMGGIKAPLVPEMDSGSIFFRLREAGSGSLQPLRRAKTDGIALSMPG